MLELAHIAHHLKISDKICDKGSDNHYANRRYMCTAVLINSSISVVWMENNVQIE